VLEGEGNCSAFHGLLSFASGVSARPFSVGVYAVPSSSKELFKKNKSKKFVDKSMKITLT
jgi:hypothetical protein